MQWYFELPQLHYVESAAELGSSFFCFEDVGRSDTKGGTGLWRLKLTGPFARYEQSPLAQRPIIIVVVIVVLVRQYVRQVLSTLRRHSIESCGCCVQLCCGCVCVCYSFVHATIFALHVFRADVLAARGCWGSASNEDAGFL